MVTEAASMFDPLKGSGDPPITTFPVAQLVTSTTDTVTPLTATGPPASGPPTLTATGPPASGPPAASLFSNQQGGQQFLTQSQTVVRPPSPLTQPTTGQAPPTTGQALPASTQQPSGYSNGYQQQQQQQLDQSKVGGYSQAPYTQTYSAQPTAQPSSKYQSPATGYPPSSTTPGYPPSNAYQQQPTGPTGGNYTASYGGGANAYQPPAGGYPPTQGQPQRPNYTSGYGTPRPNPYKVGY